MAVSLCCQCAKRDGQVPQPRSSVENGHFVLHDIGDEKPRRDDWGQSLLGGYLELTRCD